MPIATTFGGTKVFSLRRLLTPTPSIVGRRFKRFPAAYEVQALKSLAFDSLWNTAPRKSGRCFSSSVRTKTIDNNLRNSSNAILFQPEAAATSQGEIVLQKEQQQQIPDSSTTTRKDAFGDIENARVLIDEKMSYTLSTSSCLHFSGANNS